METLAWFIVGFLAVRTLISLVNLLSGLHLPRQTSLSSEKVSILIPARNEAANIGNLLESLQRNIYPYFEVWICNDHSTDQTAEILEDFASKDTRFRWFEGEDLPADWLGKNFACHQLAQKATGQYLIFLDADVTLSRDAISRAVAFFQEKKLSLLSVFPQQEMRNFAEQTTVPIMNWILQSLLPMKLVQITKSPSLSAANGQFMMFEAANYRQNQWHEQVKNRNVEDILLARMIKTSGLKMAVLLGSSDIHCRMYETWSDAVLGFSRNIHQYFGGAKLVMATFWAVVVAGPFVVGLAFGMHGFLLFATLVAANRVFVSAASRQNVLWSVLLHPFQMISFTAVVFYNLYRRKRTEWKGRTIALHN